MGDINARLGCKQDYIAEIDDVTERVVLDKTSNKHGDVFYEFLLENKMCVVNSRITTEFDNYTCVSSKGRSVVDYFAVPIGCLNNCIKCEVKTARSLINEYCIPADIDVNLPGMIPDHSVLLLNVKTNSHTQPIPNTTTTTNLNMNTDTSQGYT